MFRKGAQLKYHSIPTATAAIRGPVESLEVELSRTEENEFCLSFPRDIQTLADALGTVENDYKIKNGINNPGQKLFNVCFQFFILGETSI